jgi:hypothetical protein
MPHSILWAWIASNLALLLYSLRRELGLAEWVWAYWAIARLWALSGITSILHYLYQRAYDATARLIDRLNKEL